MVTGADSRSLIVASGASGGGDWLQALQCRGVLLDGWEPEDPADRPVGTGDSITGVAALALIVGVIHLVVSVSHAEEYWLFGVFFGVVGMLQVAWAVSIYRGASPTSLFLGGVGNASVIVAWIVSRSIGFPLGPEPWEPESIDVLSVLATLDEAFLVVAAWSILPERSGKGARRVLTARAAERLAIALAIASLTALILLGGHHAE